MRPVHLCDLDAATRVVLAATVSQRAEVAAQLVLAADTADRYRKRFGRVHPMFGSGTLMSAASGLPRASLSSCNAEYRSCLAVVLQALNHQSA